jgi:D-alanyl-D-alanine dipeptidase
LVNLNVNKRLLVRLQDRKQQMNQQVTLVDIRARFPALAIDLNASADNITGQPIYAEARCLLHPDAAAALERSCASRSWRA